MNDEPLSTEILSFVIPSKLQNVTAGSSRRRRARFHIRSLILVLHLIEKSGRDERGWSLSGSADWWDRFRPRIALWLPRRPSVRSECPSPPPPGPRAHLSHQDSLLTKYQRYHPRDYVFRARCWPVYRLQSRAKWRRPGIVVYRRGGQRS